MITELENILKPKFENDVYTWHQIKNAISKIKHSDEKEPTIMDCMKEFNANYNERIQTLFDTPLDMAKRLFADGMRHQFNLQTGKIKRQV